MKKYKNIFEENKELSIKRLLQVNAPWGGDIINEFKFPNKKVFYFSYIFSFKGIFQLEKSDNNNSRLKISEFKDEYMLDGHNDEYEDFDETNEVFEGEFSKNFLYKVESDKIANCLNEKLDAFREKNGEECEFRDFFKSLNENWEMPLHPEDAFGLILKSIGVNENDFEVIYEDRVNNKKGDIVCWYQYSDLYNEEFSVEIVYEKEEIQKLIEVAQKKLRKQEIDTFYEDFFIYQANYLWKKKNKFPVRTFELNKLTINKISDSTFSQLNIGKTVYDKMELYGYSQMREKELGNRLSKKLYDKDFYKLSEKKGLKLESVHFYSFCEFQIKQNELIFNRFIDLDKSIHSGKIIYTKKAEEFLNNVESRKKSEDNFLLISIVIIGLIILINLLIVL